MESSEEQSSAIMNTICQGFIQKLAGVENPFTIILLESVHCDRECTYAHMMFKGQMAGCLQGISVCCKY